MRCWSAERVRRPPTPSPPKQDPCSHDDPAVLLLLSRATNAGRHATGQPPVTPLQLERQMKKLCVGMWSEKQKEFEADVEAFGSALYMQQAVDLHAPEFLRLLQRLETPLRDSVLGE
jgi:hypothetical protein